MTEHTKDILAKELTKAGLEGMAKKASEGYYHDYLSPLAMPCQQLYIDLTDAGTRDALALRDRHIQGEFDASPDESDQWAASKDGQDTLSQLPPDLRRFFTKPN